jgi:type III secretion protein R
MNNQLANPVVMVIVLGALSLAPFVVIMMTSFVKISVSLSILRNALGTQQVPPSQVITGLSFVLTLFIMSPVVGRMYNAAGNIANTRDIFSEASVKTLFDAADKGKEPLRKFLGQHAHPKDRMLFMNWRRAWINRPQPWTRAPCRPPRRPPSPFPRRHPPHRPQLRFWTRTISGC